MATHPNPDDEAAVRAAVQTFFDAFVSGPELEDRMTALRDVLLPDAMVVRTCGDEPVRYDVDSFIRPRRELLSSGEVADFVERPRVGRVDVFGDVAQWFGAYTKSWTQGGTAQHGAGMKSIQLVRTGAGWRISAAAWDDERPGLELPASLDAATAPPHAGDPPAPAAPPR